MITNYARNIYKIMEQATFDEEKPKTKGSGLLAPVKNFMRSNEEDNTNQPLFRIAKYVDTIRKKRLEYNNDTRKTTEI